MRFLIKRPRMEDVSEELDMLMEIMVSKPFVIIDLIFFSVIFTLFLAPVLSDAKIAILFFCGSFALFYSIYFFFFYPFIKNG